MPLRPCRLAPAGGSLKRMGGVCFPSSLMSCIIYYLYAHVKSKNHRFPAWDVLFGCALTHTGG